MVKRSWIIYCILCAGCSFLSGFIGETLKERILYIIVSYSVIMLILISHTLFTIIKRSDENFMEIEERLTVLEDK